MSFFKDFKDDLSQAVNDLMPQEAAPQEAPQMVDTISEPVAAAIAEPVAEPVSEADELASLLATLDMEVVNEAVNEAAPEESVADTSVPNIPVYTETVAPVAEEKPQVQSIFAPEPEPVEEEVKEHIAPIFAPDPEPVEEIKEVVAPIFAPDPEPVAEEVKETVAPIFAPESSSRPSSKNTSFGGNMKVGNIPEGMTIIGDIESDGSLDVLGTVKGNISVLGKLNVTGTIEGNSKASEVFADGAKIVGEIVSQGTVKVGNSSIIKGNVVATSAVLAGAIKGDIDVKGPVVLDSTAIIMGNIKSKSIQINNGAAIEGLCSQCYADVSPVSFFTED